MPNRLADAVSPYLRSHAGNPVDWWPWGEQAFAEAERRDVPVLVSIGYATCHWCHVMARESFSDDALAAYLNENFVSVKVDREEHPDVDAGYLAAAAAFTRNLGWPLNVFTTPRGRVFFASTYSPPLPLQGHPSFRQLLEAVTDAWANRRESVEQTADAVAGALAEQPPPEAAEGVPDLAAAVAALAAQEDALYGGFALAPKFPVAPVLGFLLAVPEGRQLATRTLHRMAASPLRDPVEGGFFRYSTLRDWGDPHYERMLYDNAQLLSSFAELGRGGDAEAVEIADGIASYLLTVLRLPSGAFASAQDSESDIDGTWSEGGYYRATASERATLKPPRLDEKVLTGWNGLAIGALARAGFVLDRPDWVRAAGDAADYLLERHVVERHGVGGRLVRVSLGDRASDAVATLEDYGMLAGGLLQLALAGGGARYAVAGRELIDAVLAGLVEGGGSRDDRPRGRSLDPRVSASLDPQTTAGRGGSSQESAGRGGASQTTAGRGGALWRASLETTPAITAPAIPFAVPGGPDPVLASRGLALPHDPSEGAYPSGLSACAHAALTLYELTADARYLDAATRTAAVLSAHAVAGPLGFGTTLELLARLAAEHTQLVVVMPDAAPVPATPAASASLVTAAALSVTSATAAVVVTPDAAPAASELVTAARTHPASVTALVTESTASELAALGFEVFAARATIDGVPTAYLCRDFTCRLPVTTAEGLREP